MALSSFGASSVRLILWFYSHHSSNFLNFFLLNKHIKGWMYSERSSGFVRSSSLPISCYSLSCISIAYALLVLNVMFWWSVQHVFGHLVNHIVPIFQFTSRLYLTNQSYPKNMSVLFRLVTAASIFFLCLLISTSSGTNHVTSPFLVLFVLKTLNTISADFVWICSFLTSCLLIFMYMHLESTSTCSHNFFFVCVFTFACILSSLSLSFH